MEVSKLINFSLDWTVAKCEGKEAARVQGLGDAMRLFRTVGYDPTPWQPSTDWAQGGPIIEREGICLYFNPEDADAFEWHAEDRSHALYLEGPTPLIAAMRCYVASKLGDEMDIPEGLL